MRAKEIRRLVGTCAAVVTAAGGLWPVPKLIRRPPPGKGGEVGLVGYSQFDGFSCGFVAALDVLHTLKPPRTAYRRLAEAMKLWRELNPDPDHGVSLSRLVRCLRRRGVRVSVRHDLCLVKIVAAIDAGMPVITAVNTSDPDTDHWIVIRGYARHPNRVYLSNTTFVRGLASAHQWSEFARHRWSEPGHGLVCSLRARRGRC